MNAAREEKEDDLWAALLFRDGLMLCILASAPVRVGAFAKATIDGHLRLEDNDLAINYAWTETKQKREEERHLPLELAAAIREWIKDYRSRLVRVESEKALWLSLCGTPLTSSAISSIIADLTENAPEIRIRISAHRIRDCVVSTIAERAPAQAQISCEILQHSQDGTVRIYDQHASQIEAVRQARATRETLLDDIRRTLRQEGNPEALHSRPLSYLHTRPKRRRRRRAELPNAA
jgi:site-specific recombinase XerD